MTQVSKIKKLSDHISDTDSFLLSWIRFELRSYTNQFPINQEILPSQSPYLLNYQDILANRWHHVQGKLGLSEGR